MFRFAQHDRVRLLMRTFGGFRSGDKFFYGEVVGEEVHLLKNPYWTEIERTGDVRKLADLRVDLPVAPSKLIAVGLNYSDHIAEMKRSELGVPLIWFRSEERRVGKESRAE